MQTFMPDFDFRIVAATLDHKRLGKQRVEALQLLQAFNDLANRWRNHPVFRMWYMNRGLLAAYGIAMCNHWAALGYSDNCKNRIIDALPCDTLRQFAITYATTGINSLPEMYELPEWMKPRDGYNIRSEYRAILLEKNFKHYGKMNWSEDPKPKMQYPLYPIMGDLIQEHGIVAEVVASDCVGNGFVINPMGEIYNVEHVEKIVNSVHHLWRVVS